MRRAGSREGAAPGGWGVARCPLLLGSVAAAAPGLHPAAMALGVPLLVGSLQPLTIDGPGGSGLLLAESQRRPVSVLGGQGYMSGPWPSRLRRRLPSSPGGEDARPLPLTPQSPAQGRSKSRPCSHTHAAGPKDVGVRRTGERSGAAAGVQVVLKPQSRSRAGGQVWGEQRPGMGQGGALP